jgi:steroid 5-alpha reductase family enzyme
MDPLQNSFAVCMLASVIVWVVSLITKEYSTVDRMWSIIPVVYIWIFTLAADFADTRLNFLAIIVTIWGARLTFNFWRKGGYAAGGEDYRWAVLQEKITGWQWQLFNFAFIAVYQNILLWLIALPAWTAFEHRSTPFGLQDVALIALFLLCTLGETIADEQQWRFYARRSAMVAQGMTPTQRFLTEGLFRFSRHPNFFFEQCQWWVVFLIGASAAGSLTQWTVLGALLLTALFLGSTNFTEEITLSKYPEYSAYQTSTSVLIPFFPGCTSLDALVGVVCLALAAALPCGFKSKPSLAFAGTVMLAVTAAAYQVAMKSRKGRAALTSKEQ